MLLFANQIGIGMRTYVKRALRTQRMLTRRNEEKVHSNNQNREKKKPYTRQWQKKQINLFNADVRRSMGAAEKSRCDFTEWDIRSIVYMYSIQCIIIYSLRFFGVCVCNVQLGGLGGGSTNECQANNSRMKKKTKRKKKQLLSMNKTIEKIVFFLWSKFQLLFFACEFAILAVQRANVWHMPFFGISRHLNKQYCMRMGM